MKLALITTQLLVTSFLLSQDAITYHVTASTLNVRAEPNTTSTVLDKLEKYDNVEVVDQETYPGWTYVEYSTGKGFVYNKYISEGKAIVRNTSYRVGAVCRDGTRSSATGRGACSHHGGVARWITRTKKSARIIK